MGNATDRSSIDLLNVIAADPYTDDEAKETLSHLYCCMIDADGRAEVAADLRRQLAGLFEEVDGEALQDILEPAAPWPAAIGDAKTPLRDELQATLPPERRMALDDVVEEEAALHRVYGAFWFAIGLGLGAQVQAGRTLDRAAYATAVAAAARAVDDGAVPGFGPGPVEDGGRDASAEARNVEELAQYVEALEGRLTRDIERLFAERNLVRTALQGASAVLDITSYDVEDDEDGGRA